MNDKFLKEDEILILIRELFEKWKKVRVRRFMVDKEIIFSPVYLGINLKKIKNFSVISENGGLVNDLKKPTEYTHIGFCVTVGIGDFDHPKANGLGMGHYTDRTSLKLNALKKNINKAIDGAFKMALSEYFQHHSQISEYKKDKEFQKLSRGESTNYYDAEKRLIWNSEKIAQVIEEAENLISKNKKIKHSKLEFSITEENRWFASLERQINGKEAKNKIFTSDIHGFINWMIIVKDIKGRDIKFYETRKLTDDFDYKKEIDNLQRTMEDLAEKFHKAPELESGLYRTALSPETTYMIVSSKKSLSSDEIFKMMIEALKRHNEPFGLYINGRSGEVEIESGQFKIYVSEFYKIYPDGKREPVSSAFISGSAYETLNQVKAVGNNLTECIGHCGSSSGWVRASGLCPSVYFRKIQVLSSAENPDDDSLMDSDDGEDNGKNEF